MKSKHSETVLGHPLPSVYLETRQTNGENVFRVILHCDNSSASYVRGTSKGASRSPCEFYIIYGKIIAMVWAAEGSWFESKWRQKFSLLHTVHTGSGAHRAPCRIGIWGYFPGAKATEA